MSIIIDLFKAAIEFLRSVWDSIKKFWVRIINFAKNIVNWFKTPARLRKLKADSNKIAVAIKENLENGEVNVVKCLYDKSTNTVDDDELQKEGVGIEAYGYDEETANAFGDKPMVILS